MNTNENAMRIEVFRPEISGQFQNTTLEELKTWIKEGTVKPNHQVRVANLTWVEVQKIPAFKTYFESKENEQQFESTDNKSKALPERLPNEPLKNAFTPATIKLSNNQPTTVTFSPEPGKPKIDEAKVLPAKTPSATPDIPVKTMSEPVEPSIPFQILEKKELAKNKTIETKIKPTQSLPAPQKKSSLAKKAVGFLVGCVLVSLFSLGGSYLWVYQLKTPVEIDEKSLIELSKMEDKLTSDKLDLRLKEAANKQGNPAQQFDVSKEIAKLENQFNIQRKSIIENHRNNIVENDFNNTLSFSFAVLMVLFLLIRIFYGKNDQSPANQSASMFSTLQTTDALKIPPTVLQNNQTIEPENAQAAKSAERKPTETSNKEESSDENLKSAENSFAAETENRENADVAEPAKIRNCLLHRDEPAKFVCEDCSNHFCDECPKTFDQLKNCCPFCQVVCKSLEPENNKAAPTQIEAEEKAKPSLLELGKNTEFVTFDYPDERTRKLGIIPAFVISLLISGSLSIFWVYKISPYLEAGGKEVAQNVAPNETQKSAKGDGAIDPEDNTCVDPKTNQSFNCSEEKDEALREILRDHAKQVKSVDKAKADIKEKTNLILSVVSSEARDEVNKAKEKDSKPNPVEDAQKEKDKQLLIKVFIGSFLLIFSLLMSTRFFSKGK